MISKNQNKDGLDLEKLYLDRCFEIISLYKEKRTYDRSRFARNFLKKILDIFFFVF